jgi:hypothetical protein
LSNHDRGDGAHGTPDRLSPNPCESAKSVSGGIFSVSSVHSVARRQVGAGLRKGRGVVSCEAGMKLAMGLIV